jgi:hypothetical protein
MFLRHAWIEARDTAAGLEYRATASGLAELRYRFAVPAGLLRSEIARAPTSRAKMRIAAFLRINLRVTISEVSKSESV